MNKVFQLFVIAYIALYLSDNHKQNLKDASAKKNVTVSQPRDNETVAISDLYRKISITRPYYRKDACEASAKLYLPVHLLVN